MGISSSAIHVRFRIAVAVCLSFLSCAFFPSAARAIPRTITISGYVAGPDSQPLSGDFAAKLLFFNSESAPTEIDSVQTTTTLKLGYFGITIEPPTGIVSLDEVWYALGIDTNENGIDPSDFFTDRFRITSVPYALSGIPATSFVTGNADSFGVNGTTTTLHLAPFTTPPGGVEFNRIVVEVYNNGNAPHTASFGIYSREGNLLFLAGPQVIPAQSGGLIEFPVSGSLAPSTTYFSGWGRDSHQNTFIGLVRFQPLPGFGSIPGVVSDGLIPNSFDPSAIVRIGAPCALGLILRPPEDPGPGIVFRPF